MKTELNTENYSKGFLVDDQAIGGVTEMAGGIFAAYVSDHQTSETLAYQEFPALEPALSYLNSMERAWAYEGVGCSKVTSAKKSCGTGCSC